MKSLKKLFSLMAIGVFLIAIVGCSDHGHSHDGKDGHSHSNESEKSQQKHDTLK
ncbi:hypothetical protein [Halarcobacter bivalviorum]|uniref:hypothetical protein n=1 Tax=Halarcobacter bivalviorum TaxID=663364 RepID=UPI0013E961CC|nr:hypothetical protein [Halarcobacter bivalviorum]